jgi:hypothetical protein
LSYNQPAFILPKNDRVREHMELVLLSLIETGATMLTEVIVSFFGASAHGLVADVQPELIAR